MAKRDFSSPEKKKRLLKKRGTKFTISTVKWIYGGETVTWWRWALGRGKSCRVSRGPDLFALGFRCCCRVLVQKRQRPRRLGRQIRTWDRSIGGSIPKGKHSGENKTQRQRHGEVIGLKFTHWNDLFFGLDVWVLMILTQTEDGQRILWVCRRHHGQMMSRSARPRSEWRRRKWGCAQKGRRKVSAQHLCVLTLTLTLWVRCDYIHAKDYSFVIHLKFKLN